MTASESVWLRSKGGWWLLEGEEEASMWRAAWTGAADSEADACTNDSGCTARWPAIVVETERRNPGGAVLVRLVDEEGTA